MIDQAGDFVLSILKGWGAPGAIIIVLLWRIWKIEEKRDEAQTEIKNVLKEASKDAKENAKVLADFTTASEARNRLSEASVRSQELSTAAIGEMRAEVRSQIDRLREDVARRWGQQ